MENRSLLRPTEDLTFTNELAALNTYKRKSTIFKNVKKAAIHYQTTTGKKVDIMENLDKASTFSDMIHILDTAFLNPGAPIWERLVVKGFCFVSGFFSPQANLGHYMFQLKDDIINHALEYGYNIIINQINNNTNNLSTSNIL